MFTDKIRNIIEEPLKFKGYEPLQIRFHKSNKRSNLQILLEKTDGSPVTVQDCENASHTISLLLDVEDPIKGEYNLEVSSPGIDRPLVKLRDYDNYIGFDAKIQLEMPVDNRRNITGILTKAEENEVSIKLTDGSEKEFQISFDNITSGKLILTDKLIAHYKNLLKQSNNSN